MTSGAIPETSIWVDPHGWVMSHWRRARTGLRQSPMAASWTVGVVVIVAVTLIALLQLLLSGHQYQVNDLSPVGPAGSMLKTCLWPYQYAGLGLPNPIPVPSLCILGGAAAVIGPTGTQHLFLLGCIGGAGLSMFRLLRRLEYGMPLCAIGALLYEFSPAIVNQFRFGGPGILLAGAVFPAILAETIVPDTQRRLIQPARAGVLLGFVTLFNPQAPFLVVPLVVPFLGAMMVRTGWRSMVQFVGVFVSATVACSLPLLLIAHGEGITAAITGPSLTTQLITSVRTTSVTQFAVPYAYFGLIPAALGAAVIAFRSDRSTFERAVVVSAAMIFLLWVALRLLPLQLVHLWIGIALFKDFIKLQMLFGVPVTVLTIAGIRIVATKAIMPKLTRMAVPLLVGAAVAGVLVSGNGAALASGNMGLTSYRVPSVYASALSALQRRAPAGSSYRVLWLPQDLPTVGTLSTLDPSSLVYRSDAAPPVRKTVLQTFDAFVESDDTDIAPLLAQDGVRFVVVATAPRMQPDATFESARPNIAAIGGTQVLAGSPRYFLDILDQAPGIIRVARANGYELYENRLWQPMLTHYRAMLVVYGPSQSEVPQTGPPLNMGFTPVVGTKWSETAGDITIVASSRPSWSPVIAEVAVDPGTEYQLSGQVTAHDALNTHIKIQWMGGSSVTTTYVVILTSSLSTKSFTALVAAPSGASIAQVMLMGGWAGAPGAFSSFGNIQMSPIVVATSSLGVAARAGSEWLLQRQLPGLLLEAGTQPTKIRTLPKADVVTLRQTPCRRSQQGCANLLSLQDVELHGSWAFAASIQTMVPVSCFTADSSGASLTIPPQVLDRFPSGSELSWTTYPDCSSASFQPLVHSVTVSSGSRSISIASPGIGSGIANLALLPPVPPHTALTRVLTAYSPTLLGEPGNQRPIAIPGDWASIYKGTLTSPPSPAGDPLVVLRLLTLGLSLALMVAVVVSTTRRARSRQRSV